MLALGVVANGWCSIACGCTNRSVLCDDHSAEQSNHGDALCLIAATMSPQQLASVRCGSVALPREADGQLPLVGLAMLAIIAATLTFGGLSTNPVDAQSESRCVSDAMLARVRHYYDINKHRAPGHGQNWKRVLVAFGDVEDSNLTAMTAASARERETRWRGWKPVRKALECIEDAAEQQPPPPPPPTPEISIAAGSAVTEGADASFTITATPAPISVLTVDVTVSQSGDFATTGSRTVTIQTSGSATLAVPTTNDTTDEPDGSVTATLASGSGYTVSTSANAATVAVSDDDVPELSIAPDGDVTEGSAASFTITADPTPHSSLSVSVSVSATGDFGVTSGAQDRCDSNQRLQVLHR